jgi:hypothetical protein
VVRAHPTVPANTTAYSNSEIFGIRLAEAIAEVRDFVWQRKSRAIRRQRGFRSLMIRSAHAQQEFQSRWSYKSFPVLPPECLSMKSSTCWASWTVGSRSSVKTACLRICSCTIGGTSGQSFKSAQANRRTTCSSKGSTLGAKNVLMRATSLFAVLFVIWLSSSVAREPQKFGPLKLHTEQFNESVPSGITLCDKPYQGKRSASRLRT